MNLLQKCPPDELPDMNATTMELYLEKEHISSFDRTLELCKQTSKDIEVVHTPHVSYDDIDYLSRTHKLAQQLDSMLLIHSSHIDIYDAIEYAESQNLNNVSFENHTQTTVDEIMDIIHNKEHELTLDIAHLYRNDIDDFMNNLRSILSTPENIRHIHLCDATKEQDHLNIMDGDIPMERVIPLIENVNVDTMTIEVMPEKQTEAFMRYRLTDNL